MGDHAILHAASGHVLVDGSPVAATEVGVVDGAALERGARPHFERASA